MSLSVTVEIFYGIILDWDEFEALGEAGIEPQDCFMDPNSPDETIYYEAASGSEKRIYSLQRYGDSPGRFQITPDMMDPLTIQLYEEELKERFKEYGVPYPGPGAWHVVVSES